MVFTLKRITAALALVSTLIPAMSFAQTKWDMPTPYPDSNFHTKNVKQFAEEVTAASGGKLNITVHSNGSLIKHPEIKRAVQTGQVNAGEVLISVLSNESPLFAFDSQPFLAPNFEATAKLWKGARPVLEKRLASQGVILLYGVAWPPQGIYTKRPFNSAAELKGIKFRTYSPSTAEFAKQLGMQPVTIQVPEIPQAFLTGAVDAMITSPATGVDTQAWDYLQFYYDVQAFLPLNMVMINKAAFDALDAATQKAVLEAGRKAEERGWKTSRDENERLVKILASKNVRIVQPSAELRAEFEAVGKKMVADWTKRAGADGEAIIGALQAK